MLTWKQQSATGTVANDIMASADGLAYPDAIRTIQVSDPGGYAVVAWNGKDGVWECWAWSDEGGWSFVSEYASASAAKASADGMAVDVTAARTTAVGDGNVSAEYFVDSDWGSGHSARIVVSVLKDITAWTVGFDALFAITNSWNGTVDRDGDHYTVRSPNYSDQLHAGQQETFGYNGEGPAGISNLTALGAMGSLPEVNPEGPPIPDELAEGEQLPDMIPVPEGATTTPVNRDEADALKEGHGWKQTASLPGLEVLTCGRSGNARIVTRWNGKDFVRARLYKRRRLPEALAAAENRLPEVPSLRTSAGLDEWNEVAMCPDTVSFQKWLTREIKATDYSD